MLPLVSISGPRRAGWPWCVSPAQLRGLPLEHASPQEYGVLHGGQGCSLVADNVGRAISCTGHQIGLPIGRLVQGPDRTGRGHRVRATGLQTAPAGGGGARGVPPAPEVRGGPRRGAGGAGGAARTCCLIII